MAIPLPRYISLAEAARQIGLSEQVLTQMIKNRTIRSIQIMEDHTLTSYALDERTVDDMAKKVAKSDLRDQIWSEVSKYENQTVTAYQARTKYGIPPDTLYNFIRNGYIRTVGELGEHYGRGHGRLLNMADVLYFSKLRKHEGRKPKSGIGSGHRIISDDTIPPHMLVEQDD